MRPVDTIVLHHSASPSGNVAMFRKEHIARGWRDVGYHYVIGSGQGARDGELQVGRPEGIVGSAVFGANTGKLHVCLVGQFDKESPGYTGKPSRAQFATLGGWLMVKMRQYGLTAQHVKGHKEVTIPGHGTLCPGSEFPLSLVRAWCLHPSHQTLSQALMDMGYFPSPTTPTPPRGDGWVAVPPPTIGPGPAVFFDRNGVLTSVGTDEISYHGKTYVSVQQLALAMNWPQPEYDAANQRVILRTTTK